MKNHRQIFDPDDSRCELVPRCTTIRTLWAADTKANAMFGHNDDVWGTFDVVWTQSFNGSSSRYRLKLIWDAGADVMSEYWVAQVRNDRRFAPDPVTGSAYFVPGWISSTRWNSVDPSLTGWKHTVGTPFTGSHHDDLYGSFTANGQRFGTSTLHLPSFHCPSHRCKYYGPTGPA